MAESVSALSPDRVRVHTRDVAWPTMGLALAVFAGYMTSCSLFFAGYLPLWAAAVLHTVFGYASFTLMHEAAHGNIHGRHRSLRWIGETIGWVSALPFLAPYPAFRVLHLQHHSHTNDPERDPDYWVASSRALGIAVRCLTIIPHYYFAFLFGRASRSQAVKKERRTVLVGMAAHAAVLVAFMALGLGVEVLFMWVVPAILATGLLAFAFDWLPHHPHDNRQRFGNTRAVLGPGLVMLTFGQCFHVVHHLFPRVPFYRYGVVFRAAHEELEERGVKILTIRP